MGLFAGRDVEVNVGAVSFGIILTSRQLNPAAKIIVGDRLLIPDTAWRSVLSSANTASLGGLPRPRTRALHDVSACWSRGLLHRSPLKHDIAKPGMTIENYVEQHIHHFMHGVSLDLVLDFSYRSSRSARKNFVSEALAVCRSTTEYGPRGG